MRGEKRFEPSRKKLEKAWGDGKGLECQVFSGVGSLIGAGVGIITLIQFSWVGNGMLLEYTNTSDKAYLLRTSEDLLMKAVFCSVWVILNTATGGIIAQFIRNGFRLRIKGMRFNFDFLNPAKGVKRLKSGLKRLWLKGLLIAGIAILSFRGLERVVLELPFRLISYSSEVQEYPADTVCRFFLWTMLLWVMAGGIDFLGARREFRKELMMSREEVEKEQKESEGEPQMKSARKRMHGEIMMEDVIERVKNAKVIIISTE